MRIREIVFNNVRSFRGEHRISFVDPVTDLVRPVTVLAGSNGSGKTTVFEAIEALLMYVYNPLQPNDFVNEVLKSGFVCLVLDLTPEDVGDTSIFIQPMPVAVGQRNLAPSDLLRSSPAVLRLKNHEPLGEIDQGDGLAMQLSRYAQQQEIENVVQGGLLYFPYDRRLGHTKGGPIERAIKDKNWLFRFSGNDRWRDSLEQLWVWQNYLDLEQRSKQSAGNSDLSQFVKSVEGALGENRHIFIEEGRVRVTTPYIINDKENSVRIDQLPSGEQQVLLLFGELARRRRQGCVLAIDEIENSLHPTLQRLIMWNLNRLAREWDAQVIVSTHSLEVINTVRGGAFINLDYPEDHFNLPVPEADANQS